MNIKESIQKIMEEKIGGHGSRLCSVLSVSGSTCDVQTLDDEVKIIGARLQTETSNGILLKPKKGSFVVVTPITDFEFVVVMWSEIDEIKLLDGSYGGLTKTQELKTQLDKTNDVVNTILTVLVGSPINEPGSGAPSALQAALHAALGTKTVGNFSAIESDKITHGTI